MFLREPPLTPDTHTSVFMSCVDKRVFTPRCYYIIGLSATLRPRARLWSVLSLSPPLPPPAVFHVFYLSEPTRPRGSVSLHQRQPVLRTRQTHSTHQRPFEFTADEPTTARSEGKTPPPPLGNSEPWHSLSGGEKGQKADNLKVK